MGKLSEIEDYSQVASYEKDSRKAKKRDECNKAHHVWFEKAGPNVIIRSQIGGIKDSFETEDVFDVSCDNIPHSLNKRNRWEKAENAEEILANQNPSGKTSFMKALLPGYSRKGIMLQTVNDLENAAIMGKKGGIKKYIEEHDGEITVRNEKSNRANLSSLQSNEGSGSHLKANRRRDRKAKSKKSEEREVISTVNEPHTRYSTIEMKRGNPKDVERVWRSSQAKRSQKHGWTRNHSVVDEHDWNSIEQDALEVELDESYEEQMEIEEPLRLPNRTERIVEVRAMPIVENSREPSITILKPIKREQSKKVIAEQERQAKLIDKEENAYRASLVEIRPTLSKCILSEVYAKAKEYFNSPRLRDGLPVFPRTIVIHKQESENFLGTKMSSCIFVASSNVTNEVNLYAAPSYCCPRTSPFAPAIEGWQTVMRTEQQLMLEVPMSRPIIPSTSLSECPQCNKIDETDELEDFVIVQRPQLFSFSCSHVACHSCWISHAKKIAKAKGPSIICINTLCNHVASLSEMAALFSDGTIGLFNQLYRENETIVQCVGCSLKPMAISRSHSTTATCVCGTKTCKSCGILDHSPLSCMDRAKWGQIVKMLCYPGYVRQHSYSDNYKMNRYDCCKTCRKCDTPYPYRRWMNWCIKCSGSLYTKYRSLYDHFRYEPLKTTEDIFTVLGDRSRTIIEENRQCKYLSSYYACMLAKHQVAEDVIHVSLLFELMQLNRFMNRQISFRRATENIGEQLDMSGEIINTVRFFTVGTKRKTEKYNRCLKKELNAISRRFTMSITVLE